MPRGRDRPYAAGMAWPDLPAPRYDLVLASALLGISQVEVWRYGAAGGSLAAALTLGLAAAALIVRRTQPIVTLTLVAAGLALCAGYAGEPFSATSVLTFTIAVYSVGAMPQRGPSIAALVVALVLSPFAVEDLTLNNYLGIALSSIATPWLLGLLSLRRGLAREEAHRRQQAAEQAVAAERLRLAQELHDTVSHNVGMIAVQAGAADVLLDKDPRRSRESLHAIEAGARSTLMELRRLLGLLRDDDPEPLDSRPTLAGLPQLIESVGRAGLTVALETDGKPVSISPEVEVTAYRIVQEALTNVVAHAGTCSVKVALRYSGNGLDVEITDDGAARPGTSRGGFGLAGISERVAAVGGTVTAGPRSDGGFVVRALLPVATQ
jgi:signal transduction histidine kinase